MTWHDINSEVGTPDDSAVIASDVEGLAVLLAFGEVGGAQSTIFRCLSPSGSRIQPPSH